ncbi:uncharacterized protein LOC103576106 isoform X1 [Microplitis demolitor]|uniref:uncharacterized protein LOC103576106 isoform X1 n=1 Tax=Microplitis demolitor TaxID=69319 RepID=UPI0004CD33F7|nr:uncharacterized protein LOC103576106 isoform X1 [Microplitis demolitor]
MGSSRPPDRSLGSGISFPQWMKGKVDSRFDFDQSTFSPPSHDDSFFYISYSKLGAGGQSSSSSCTTSSSVQPSREGFQSINSVLSETKTLSTPTTVKETSSSSSSLSQSSNIPTIKNVATDLSKHPIACQQSFTSNLKAGGNQDALLSNKLISKSQQQGSDEFHNGATSGLCGKSIVSVANRIMSASITKKVNNSNHYPTLNVDVINNTTVSSRNEMDRAELLKRRGSRSLPVSPINSPISTPDSSPKSRRRVIQNKFFTGGFLPDGNKSSSSSTIPWFLSSILNQSRDIIGHNKINEEDEVTEINDIVSPPPVRSLNRKKSISSQNLTYVGSGISISEDNKKDNNNSSMMATVQNIFQPEQSELREMNFLSPTSM